MFSMVFFLIMTHSDAAVASEEVKPLGTLQVDGKTNCNSAQGRSQTQTSK
jgi:hypothetical protein